MGDWKDKIQEFVCSIGSCAAVVSISTASGLQVVACNEDFFDMVGGRRPGHEVFPFSLESAVPSYARQRLRAGILECLRSGESQEFEQALDIKGETRWWRLSLKILRYRGRSGGVLLNGIEITQKIQLQHRLEVSGSRFKSVVDAAHDAIVTIDQQHRITLFNRAAELLFGYEEAEVIDQPLDLLIPAHHNSSHQQYVHKFARSPVKSRPMDERNRIYGLHRDGTHIPIEIAISKINVDGLMEFTAIIRDITERIHHMDLLERQASTDPLTGLPNRREFSGLVERMMKSGKPLALLAIDVDFFKKINDVYGHDVGDDVLRAIANVGLITIRARDVMARLGGEEFVVALPDTEMGVAMGIAERIREAYAEGGFDYDWKGGREISFTVSIGVACRNSTDRNYSEILKRADKALYEAKESGRNRVVNSEDGLP